MAQAKEIAVVVAALLQGAISGFVKAVAPGCFWNRCRG